MLVVADDELSAALRTLGEAAGASGVRLLRLTAGTCCRGETVFQAGESTVRLTKGACSHWVAGRTRPLFSHPVDHRPEAHCLCAATALSGGGTLCLQLGFARDPGGSVWEAWGLPGLLQPYLMWAKHLLEGGTRPAHEERERLAYEIHDRLVQTLVSALQELRGTRRTRSRSADSKSEARAAALLRQAIREARLIMDDLHPPLPGRLGLAGLINRLLEGLKSASGCEITATLTYAERLPREVEIGLYRIIQEAVVNIERHAGATHVAVSMTGDGGSIVAEVADDGVGFDVVAALATPRVGGLLSMRRRAQMVDGVCEIESSPGKGTRVRLRIPLPKEEQP